jgi:hypothetical protein
MTTPETKGVLTLAGLQQSAEYQACTPKQRFWLDTLISNGFDYTHATATAFDMKSESNAQVYSYAVRRSSAVLAALNLFQYGGDDREIFLAGLRETIRRSKEGSTAKLRAQSLYARLVYSVVEPVEDEPEETAASKIRKVILHQYDPTAQYSVDDFVSDKGPDGAVHVGLVQAINANGQPTKILKVQSAEGQPIFDAKGQVIPEGDAL